MPTQVNYNIAPKESLDQELPHQDYSGTITAFFSNEMVDEEENEEVVEPSKSISTSPCTLSPSEVCSSDGCSLQEGEEVACQFLREIFKAESR